MLCSCGTPLINPAIGLARQTAEFITPCPRCHAVWRVTAVQLRASDLSPLDYENLLNYMKGGVVKMPVEQSSNGSITDEGGYK